METVDILMHGSCANCAVKHLSHALALVADGACDDASGPPPAIFVALARASINLAEVLSGYRSHLPFAVGLLSEAESRACAMLEMQTLARIRGIRLFLVEHAGSDEAVASAIRDIEAITPARAQVYGHATEALREMPELRRDLVNALYTAMRPDELARELGDAVAGLVADYFNLPPLDEGEGGETDMATTKKTQAACKGGATKKTQAACKGGCAKKAAKKR